MKALRRYKTSAIAVVILLASARLAAGQGYDLSWYTIDSGGAMNSTSVTFSLSGTIGQPDAGPAMTGGGLTLVGGFWPVTQAAASVSIVSANPPLDNPFVAGQQPFRDVLQTGTTAALTQGIGAAGTPGQDSVTYATISVTFSAAPFPTPDPGNITVACTGGTTPCPTVQAVTGSGAGPFQLTLSGVIPTSHCTTLTFAGTNPGQKLQYQYLPGDINLSGSVSTADVLALVNGINNGQAGDPANLPRYNVNRSGAAATADILRLVQLLNGVNTTQPWAGATVAACP